MTPGAEAVVQLLTARGETLAVAESLTGGLVAAELTAVRGSSQAFLGSVTAYATEVKESVLGVDAELLAAHGAVHHEVALEMAHGVRRLLGATWGIGTTGVAGPAEQDGKPVGTVYVAVAGPFLGGDSPGGPGGGNPNSDRISWESGRGDEIDARIGDSAGKIASLRLNGDRAEIRMETVRSVFGLLLRGLTGERPGNARAQDTERNGGT